MISFLLILTSTILIAPPISSFSSIPRFLHYPSSLTPQTPQRISFSLKRATSILAPGSRQFRTSTLAASEALDADDEWEYEEYEDLAEADFYNSEWKVGTVMDGNAKIVETWCRLLVEENKEDFGNSQIQRCIWGDGSRGKWNFDKASQFLSLSKDSWGGWLGKQIWAGTVTDYYYMQGSVRGWSPVKSASVDGQWQARRLGVDKDEAGKAPWFEEDEEENETDEDVKEYITQIDSSTADDEVNMVDESIQQNGTAEEKSDDSAAPSEDKVNDAQEEIETPWFATVDDSKPNP